MRYVAATCRGVKLHQNIHVMGNSNGLLIEVAVLLWKALNQSAQSVRHSFVVVVAVVVVVVVVFEKFRKMMR